MRLQLELLKPEMTLAERGIRSTVVMFGGARLPEPGGQAWAAKNETQKKNLEENSKYYEEARKFAQPLLAAFGHLRLPRICRGHRRRARA